MADIISQESDSASGRIKERVQHAKQRAGEEWENVRERISVYGEGADEFIDSVGRYIKENPQRSAIIAAASGLGAGLILGLLLRSRR
ncbi:MAG: hypothetical protein H3C43_04920 [Leptonema sp. (in: Bacteria)]|nr:hypothetical protein [Leptonema sp. (in: bacteria)]